MVTVVATNPSSDFSSSSPPTERRGGVLYVVATPIGNLEDITLRALRVLKEVSLIAAEDTRRTRKLLNHYEIGTRCRSYYREKESRQAAEIMEVLASGRSVALVSDAGTPGIADPGAVLVNSAREAGYPVVPVPGASAPAALLSVAGQSMAAYIFLGFLPARAAERRRLLQELKVELRPLVFYESPHRLLVSLSDCLSVLGPRPVVLGRELTKMHEEIFAGGLDEVLADFKQRPAIKGEFVLLISGSPRGEEPGETRPSGEDMEQLARWYRDVQQLSLKDTARRIAADLEQPRSTVYRRLLALW